MSKGKKKERRNNDYKCLKVWFYIHCAVDVLIAIPLFLVPEIFLTALGWDIVDPVAARLVAAALLGIGIESGMVRGAGADVLSGMLNLKIIWSGTASLGLILAMWQGVQGRPPVLWLFLIVFILFNGLWIYWKLKITTYKNRAGR